LVRAEVPAPGLPRHRNAISWHRAPELLRCTYDAPNGGQMSNAVTVKVPARLHLGFLDLSGEGGRRFGSVGLPLGEPETVVTLAHAAETSVEGPQSTRAAAHLQSLCQHLGIRSRHRLVVERSIPQHA